MTTPVRHITDFLKAIEAGDYSAPLPEVMGSADPEVLELQEAVKRLSGELKATREKKSVQVAIDREMRMASVIQATLLPATTPQVEGLEFAALYQPAREVGGDYYDFIEVDPDHLGVVVADVSGKGVSGAMFMSIVRNTLRPQAMLTLSPAEVLDRTEKLLSASMSPGLFVTVFYAVIHKTTHKVRCANAGHPPLLLYRYADDQCEWIRPRGMALGISKKEGRFEREEHQFALEEKDKLVFFTDGVTDVHDESGQVFGRERLGSLFMQQRQSGAKTSLMALKDSLMRFQGKGSQADDVTVVALQKGTGGAL